MEDKKNRKNGTDNWRGRKRRIYNCNFNKTLKEMIKLRKYSVWQTICCLLPSDNEFPSFEYLQQ